MLEIPEATVVASQIHEVIMGETVVKCIAGQHPHKFAWYYGDPSAYQEMIADKTVSGARSWGGFVEVTVQDMTILFGDGVNLTYHAPGAQVPGKHQLMIQFLDGSNLTGSVQMYGGLWCFPTGQFDNPYYHQAKEKPSPMADAFTWEYFKNLIYQPKIDQLSAKAFLATEQRIPGLGNGVLQDILFESKIHPKRRIKELGLDERQILHQKIKDVLKEMTDQGGRDTEKDLYDQYGRYRTKMSRLTVGAPCSQCGGVIEKAAYLGGSIYFCSECQKL